MRKTGIDNIVSGIDNWYKQQCQTYLLCSTEKSEAKRRGKKVKEICSSEASSGVLVLKNNEETTQKATEHVYCGLHMQSLVYHPAVFSFD